MLFYTILILTLIGSIINMTFFANMTRSKDPLILGIARSICISILLIPLLFIGDFSNVTTNFIIASIIIGVIGAFGLYIQYESYKYLPIGIVSALINLNNIGVLILSYLVFGETLSLIGYMGAFVILSSLSILGIVQKQEPTLNLNYKKGLLLMFIRVITVAIWVFGFMYYSREVNVYITVFVAEFTVLLGLMPILGYFLLRGKKYTYKIFTKKQGIKFFFMCLLPAFSSFGLFYASTIGSASITVLTISTTSIFVAIFSYFFYKEKLNTIQWSMIVLSVIGLFMINI